MAGIELNCKCLNNNVSNTSKLCKLKPHCNIMQARNGSTILNTDTGWAAL